ncbi:hypothetical protein AB7V82_12305 [Providencia stuartii]|uniref:hypothetical protein n=1 Tax=Providencia stuartii TaxID=588 RepID=UPI0034E3906E
MKTFSEFFRRSMALSSQLLVMIMMLSFFAYVLEDYGQIVLKEAALAVIVIMLIASIVVTLYDGFKTYNNGWGNGVCAVVFAVILACILITGLFNGLDLYSKFMSLKSK